MADYLPVALIKLFVHPLLIFALAAAALALGAPMSAFQLTVLTLAAALPSASNVSLLAERYGADDGGPSGGAAWLAGVSRPRFSPPPNPDSFARTYLPGILPSTPLT